MSRSLVCTAITDITGQSAETDFMKLMLTAIHEMDIDDMNNDIVFTLAKGSLHYAYDSFPHWLVNVNICWGHLHIPKTSQQRTLQSSPRQDTFKHSEMQSQKQRHFIGRFTSQQCQQCKCVIIPKDSLFQHTGIWCLSFFVDTQYLACDGTSVLVYINLMYYTPVFVHLA